MDLACGFRFLQLDDSAADPDRDRLGAIARPELVHDVLDVNLYGFFRDEEFFRDVAIPVSPGNSAKDFYLARRQIVVAQMFRKPPRQLRGDALFPRVALAHHSTPLLGSPALQPQTP